MKDRIALVIGNSNYTYAAPLINPQNDANDIESVLNRLNFDVTKVIDTSLIDLQQAINTFLQDLDEYAVGLLFYAGHGMQIDGKNYIVPTDLKISDKGRTQVSCYCFNSFLDGVSSYKGKTIICILDACRSNPFATNRGCATGFAPFSNPPKGTIIAYSTSADCDAYDGLGCNSLYTQVLKDSMLIPNLKIEEMFKSVRNKVSEISTTQYGEEQLSWEYSSLVGDFIFLLHLNRSIRMFLTKNSNATYFIGENSFMIAIRNKWQIIDASNFLCKYVIPKKEVPSDVRFIKKKNETLIVEKWPSSEHEKTGKITNINLMPFKC